MLRDWNVGFVHTLREGNSCADWFAKLNVSLTNELRIIPTFPYPLSIIFLDDAIRILFPVYNFSLSFSLALVFPFDKKKIYYQKSQKTNNKDTIGLIKINKQ
jgi:hypothetical protein